MEGRESRIVWGCARLWASSERSVSPIPCSYILCMISLPYRLQGGFQKAYRSPCRLTGFPSLRYRWESPALGLQGRHARMLILVMRTQHEASPISTLFSSIHSD